MKKFAALSFCLVLALLSGVSSIAFAAEKAGPDSSVDLSDTALTPEECAAFRENVANDEKVIQLVTAEAEKKERGISLEGVHPEKCIKLYGDAYTKLYGLVNFDKQLQSLWKCYEETGRIRDRISEDYAVLVFYVNENDEYVDSFVFTRKENRPKSPDRNGWVPLCSGGLSSDDEFLAEYSETGSLEKYVEGLGLEGAETVKLTTSILYFPDCLYFVQKGEEFLVPLHDGIAGVRAFQVYRVKDIAEHFLKPILDYRMEAAEQYANLDSMEIPYGDPWVPDDLPKQTPVDLNTYFDASQQDAAEEEPAASPASQAANTASPADKESAENPVPWLPILIGAGAVVLLTVGAVIAVRKHSGHDQKYSR